ncbi:MAG: hypothetical protein J6X81_03240, partial [Muribaculaceae bacterium]|nr:hypothetical protein [Muribaculaceae bacterium]
MKRTKQTFWRALAIATALLTMPATVCADSAFSGGNGSMTSPYIINTVADLRQLAEDVNNGNTYEGKYFNQYYDIDFGGEKLMPIGGKKYEVYDPTVGAFTNGERAFLGHYDGYYKQIKNVNIIQPDDFISAGLFGCISSEAVVECVLISGNTTISGTGNCGAIVGTLAGLATVKKCHVSSDVVVQVEQGAPTTTNYSYGGVAGLVAKANSTIEECSSQALVTDQAIAGKRVGGLVGRNQGKIKNCYSLGRVASVGTRGNFVGDNTGGTIINGYYNTSVRVGEVNGADVDEVKWIGTIIGGDGVDCNILAPDYLFVENRFTQNKYYLAGEKVYLRPTYNAPPL